MPQHVYLQGKTNKLNFPQLILLSTTWGKSDSHAQSVDEFASKKPWNVQVKSHEL